MYILVTVIRHLEAKCQATEIRSGISENERNMRFARCFLKLQPQCPSVTWPGILLLRNVGLILLSGPVMQILKNFLSFFGFFS